MTQLGPTSATIAAMSLYRQETGKQRNISPEDFEVVRTWVNQGCGFHESVEMLVDKWKSTDARLNQVYGHLGTMSEVQTGTLESLKDTRSRLDSLEASKVPEDRSHWLALGAMVGAGILGAMAIAASQPDKGAEAYRESLTMTLKHQAYQECLRQPVAVQKTEVAFGVWSNQEPRFRECPKP